MADVVEELDSENKGLFTLSWLVRAYKDATLRQEKDTQSTRVVNTEVNREQEASTRCDMVQWGF